MWLSYRSSMKAPSANDNFFFARGPPQPAQMIKKAMRKTYVFQNCNLEVRNHTQLSGAASLACTHATTTSCCNLSCVTIMLAVNRMLDTKQQNVHFVGDKPRKQTKSTEMAGRPGLSCTFTL